MEDRYGFFSQSSSLWRSLRNGDFEEEDVWAVLKERKDYGSKVGQSIESPISVQRHLPTAARMIPRASSSNSSSNPTHESKEVKQQSAPVNIPDWSKIYRKNKPKKVFSKNASLLDDDGDHENDDDYDNDDDDDGVMNDGGDSDDDDDDDVHDYKAPPHELIARRLARSQISSFSVFEGAGRTLKGRDLSKVRHAVLTKTGFLE